MADTDAIDGSEGIDWDAVLGGGKASKSRAARNQKHKQKQRERRAAQAATESGSSSDAPAAAAAAAAPPSTVSVNVDYVAPNAEQTTAALGAEFAELADVFKNFGGRSAAAAASEADFPVSTGEDHAEGEGGEEWGEDDAAGEDGGDGAVSRRARKKLLQFSVAELKQSVAHPEVVEAHDVTSSNPMLLVYLKAYRNTVPVPRHWCHKRKYLQGKRGFEKPPFALPDFIAATGISKLRGADLEKADAQSMKGKQREKFQPKMGKIEIDYEVLHDAFFKFQTLPKLSAFGELYYEGREFEKGLDRFKPGVLSDRLREALGMADPLAPPPWLVNMQRYGPPPSYSHLRVPGLNCPLPKGASYGYHAAGWGKPPVDEYGRPLYGDVFGVAEGGAAGGDVAYVGAGANGTGAVAVHWGEIPKVTGLEASAAGASAAPEEPEGLVAPPPAPPEEDGGPPAPPPPPDASGTETPAGGDGTYSVSSSMISGLETPATLDLRKGGSHGAETPAAAASGGDAPQLYRVLEERSTGLKGTLLGTTHAYVMPPPGAAAAGGAPASASGGSGGGGVAVALNPEDLAGMDEAALTKKYEAELAATSKVRPLLPLPCASGCTHLCTPLSLCPCRSRRTTSQTCWRSRSESASARRALVGRGRQARARRRRRAISSSEACEWACEPLLSWGHRLSITHCGTSLYDAVQVV